MAKDKFYMAKALVLAAKARGRTSPNPLVGAVIVQDDKVVGEGWHKQAGLPHAEIIALQEAGDKAKGSTIYVTLEPCSHQGRTGPCADALVKAGVKKVVVATRDPNPLVAGRGIARLQEAGIEVSENVLQKEALKLNEVFFSWITSKMPFVAVKYAMSLDGKIACFTGESKWITGPAARERVQELRNIYDGILVGIGTVLADDPELTCRLPGGRNPVRVIVDTKARIPLESKVLQDGQARTILAVSELAPLAKVQKIKAETVAEVLTFPLKNNQVDLKKLLKYLGENQLTSLLVEGGGEIHSSMFKANLVKKVYAFISPKIIGGRAAPGPVGGEGIAKIAQAKMLEELQIEQIKGDILLTGYLKRSGECLQD